VVTTGDSDPVIVGDGTRAGVVGAFARLFSEESPLLDGA
jgi:hypothetical protein